MRTSIVPKFTVIKGRKGGNDVRFGVMINSER